MEIKKLLSKSTIFLLVCCLSLFITSCNDDNNSTDLSSGTVTGIITDDYNSPLEGVVVSAEGSDVSVTTNTNGEFVLPNIVLGKSVITFKKSNYQTISVTVTPKSFSNGTALVNASMEYAAAKIEGVILDAKNGNAPLAGVTVSIGESQSVTTGIDGKYSIENLPLDAYSLTFAKSGYATITRTVGIDGFIDGIATIDVTMGGRQILRDKTYDDLQNADHWFFNEYRGGKNAESYPHWDWSTDFMATFDFCGWWEEQNEGTTLQIRNDDANQSNPADLNVFDSYVYGLKHITADNAIMTIQCRTHATSADDPAVWGVQIIDMSDAEPQVVKLGDNRTLDITDGNYSNEVFDLSSYIGKDVIIAVGIYRARTGDYWKQLVLRRIAFCNKSLDGWGWLPGTPINDELSGWALTQEMVRSTMPETKWSFSGVTPGDVNTDNLGDAYHSWRTVSHIGAVWSFVPLHKDAEPFANEGFVMKTNGGGTPVSTIEPQAYFYAKFAIQNGHNHLVLKCRNFSSEDATFFKLTAIDENMNVKHISPSDVAANNWSKAADGCVKFIHENGDTASPDGYATFTFDLSEFNGKNEVLVLGVYKVEDNDGENKLCIYSINVN